MWTEDAEPVYGERHPCPRMGCRCTHLEPCDRGWVTVEQDEKVKGVRPCPTCDPERAHLFANARSRTELQQQLQGRSRSARRDAYEREEGERTRTL